MPEQITTPLYTGEYDEYNFRIPTGEIYICFNKDTTESMIDTIIKEFNILSIDNKIKFVAFTSILNQALQKKKLFEMIIMDNISSKLKTIKIKSDDN